MNKTKFKIPFIGRGHKYTQEEVDEVSRVMNSAIPLTQGNYLREFQKKFCKYTGSNYSFAVNNATAALEMAAQLCLFASKDEVIIPGHTYTASAYPFLKKGAKVVWADIDVKSRVISAETIEACITKNTKAIVVVHLYGFGANMKSIMELATKHNLIVIEDAAQALGVEIDGKIAGTFGNFGIYSFHSHKNLSTLGEGGMLTVRDKNIADIIPMLRHNGHCDFDYERVDYWKPAMGNVDLPELNGKVLLPNNYCLGEVECALGIKLLDRLDQMNSQKRNRALLFIDELKGNSELEFHRVENKGHNYHLLVARMKSTKKRDSFINLMAKEEGIQCVVQYYPLYRYDLYVKMGYGEANCPNTDTFFDSMVSFPFQHMMTDSDFNLMIKASKRTLKKLS